MIEDKDKLYLAVLSEMRNEIEKLHNELEYLKQCILASELHSAFSKFKNSMFGKDVALVATGPSAKYFEPIKNCIYVGVNGAIYLKNILLDYIFVQDYTIDQPGNKNLNRDIYNFDNGNKSLLKFWGIHSSKNIRFSKINNLYPIPSYYVKDDGHNYRYVLSRHNFEMSHDINLEPLEDMGSTVLSALQFILYCNPARIYLIGCDCTSGHASKEGYIKSNNYYQKKIWLEYVKPFLDIYYPHIEIISINPVRLKGLFTDLFQKKYIKNSLEFSNFVTDFSSEEIKDPNDSILYYKLLNNLAKENIKEVYIYCGGFVCEKVLDFLAGSDIHVVGIFDERAKNRNVFVRNFKLINFENTSIDTFNKCQNFIVASLSSNITVEGIIKAKFRNTSLVPKIFKITS